MNIIAEVTIDENRIIRQMEKVKEAGDKYEDEIFKLRGMLAQTRVTEKVEKEKVEEK